ncbi:aliphatic nitrilase [Aureimonas sp. Leaf454]|uniref:Nit6803 family nitrilase n=1 Tax=Aureimonas sp. Leaf454 TaxID=1736381 RepID=UPI0006FB84BA|nr:Nit6803 family nitrilase [Aureimonas sp. Leaf454]KQT43038.1 aliphatic nitrilase [Aureimonas sp. Leaf454]
MARSVVRAAAAQISPVLDRPGGTLEKMLATIAEAASGGADLVVFPETFLPYYPYFSFIEPPVSIGKAHLKLYEEAPTVPGPETRALAEAARRHGIVVVAGINERDGGTLYNAQLVFDADGRLALHRRKITPTYHERMIWGQGDASGLTVVETAVGRLGALACWEHFNPLARYALMAQNEAIHVAQFPGSMVGPVFADQMEIACRQHALEAASFVVNATGWLTQAQKAEIDPSGRMHAALSGGCCTAIVSPEGVHLAPPLREGEGLLYADMDMALTLKRKRMMDAVGHYARPELLHLHIDNRPKAVMSAAIPFEAADNRTHRHDDHVAFAPALAPVLPDIPGDVAGDPDHRAAILRAAAG